MPKLDKLKKKGVYFYFINQELNYLSICLAEGLEELGVPIYSNVDYYDRFDTHDSGFLFKKSKLGPSDAAVCIIEINGNNFDSTLIIKLEEMRKADDVNLVCLSYTLKFRTPE